MNIEQEEAKELMKEMDKHMTISWKGDKILYNIGNKKIEIGELVYILNKIATLLMEQIK